MQAISSFTLHAKHQSIIEQPEHELHFDDECIALLGGASDVVAQYQLDNLYLVVTVRENPKQEKLECFLFDKAFKRLDYKYYSGWVTTSFMVTGQSLVSNRELVLELNKKIRIHLTLHQSRWPWKRWRLELEPKL